MLSVEDPAIQTKGTNHELSLISLNIAEEFTPDKLLLEGYHNAFLLDGSEFNQPVMYTLGDYRTQLEGNKNIYPISNIKCRSIGCKASCSNPSSFISRFNQSEIKPIQIVKLDTDTVKYKKVRKGSITFMLSVSIF